MAVKKKATIKKPGKSKKPTAEQTNLEKPTDKPTGKAKDTRKLRMVKVKRLEDNFNLTWQVPSEKGGYDTQTFNGRATPPPGVDQALLELKPFFKEFCEIETTDEKLIKVTGISLSYKGDLETMQVGITGHKSLKSAPGVNNFNSFPKAVKNTTGQGTAAENILPEKCKKIVDKLIKEAKKFIDGRRSQTDLLDKSK